MKYLICWGSAVDSIRVGEGKDQVQAARDAFGSSDTHKMTFQKVTSHDIRTDYRRTHLCYKLLAAHEAAMNNLVNQPHGLSEDEMRKIIEAIAKVRQTLERQWGKEWARWERKGKVL